MRRYTDIYVRKLQWEALLPPITGKEAVHMLVIKYGGKYASISKQQFALNVRDILQLLSEISEMEMPYVVSNVWRWYIRR